MKKYKVTLTFLEDILGTVTKDPEVYTNYIATKAALTDEQLAEELATIEHVEEKGWTGFHKLPDGTPILLDYMIKGFFKDACSMLRRAEGTESKKITAFKKIIDGLVFVEPRQIPLELNGAKMGVSERPLRASTAQGDRIALARSDTCPKGTKMSFTILILGEVPEKLLKEWLDYGRLRGLGQWRNSGAGKFEYEIEEVL
jgi:hypothetical protein